jgi:F-type H+-transporting ATPase subunit gamma
VANTIALKRRIRSVKNTRQITKAMELVSASKMRRAQEAALASREYRNLARDILSRLRELTKVETHPLYLKHATDQGRLYIVITSDSGLAGAYNSNVLRTLTRKLRDDRDAGRSVKLIMVGRRGAQFVSRFEDIDIIGVYNDFQQTPTANDIRPILSTAKELFTGLSVDAVDIIYTDYKSSLVQQVRTERLLPAAFKASKVVPDTDAAIFEPSPGDVLNGVTERLIEVQLWQAILESQASEHAARMMAMKSASDNADDLVGDLTLSMNTARQAAITQELAEITGGAEAIK